MTGAEFLVDHLVKLGDTDVFGIPGGVVLDFLYELDRREDISAHLSFHEQCAGFAASGYAQLSGKLCVAYATKGPGITNLLTPVADAYSDGSPVLIVTAHSEKSIDKTVRFTGEQELDTVDIFKSVTKYAVRIDSAAAFPFEIKKACSIAIEGRKGPVLIDVLSSVFSENIPDIKSHESVMSYEPVSSTDYIIERLKTSRRPIFLIGDGIHQSAAENKIRELADKSNIPVLSSRCSEDVMPTSDMYFGYIGSHGIRCANFILSKADLIIALGNRLAFPINSASFKPIYENAEIIRIEYDESEAKRHIPNSRCFIENVADTINELLRRDICYTESDMWISICKRLKNELFESDINIPTHILSEAFKSIKDNVTIVNDVGNNEFWSSRAYIHAGISNRALYSKCFGALGCSLGKSIGAYYASKAPVLCVTGDQGLQLNSQELQFIGMHRLPIAILLLNNSSSGMIRDRERNRYGRVVHTTQGSGYGTPDFEKLAEAYGIEYTEYTAGVFTKIDSPILVEAMIDEDIALAPNIPKGNKCQNLAPELDKKLFDELDKL